MAASNLPSMKAPSGRQDWQLRVAQDCRTSQSNHERSRDQHCWRWVVRTHASFELEVLVHRSGVAVAYMMLYSPLQAGISA